MKVWFYFIEFRKERFILTLDMYSIMFAIVFAVIFMFFLVKDKFQYAIPFLVLFAVCSLITLPIQEKQDAISFKESTVQQLENTGYTNFILDKNYSSSSSIKIYMNNKAYVVKHDNGKLSFIEN